MINYRGSLALTYRRRNDCLIKMKLCVLWLAGLGYVRALLDAAYLYANAKQRHRPSRETLAAFACSWRSRHGVLAKLATSPYLMPGRSSSRTDLDCLHKIKHGKILRCPAVRLLLSPCCSATWPCRRPHTDSSRRQRDRQVRVIRRLVACRSVPPIPACSAIPAASATRRASRRLVETLRRLSSPPHPPLHHRHAR